MTRIKKVYNQICTKGISMRSSLFVMLFFAALIPSLFFLWTISFDIVGQNKKELEDRMRLNAFEMGQYLETIMQNDNQNIEQAHARINQMATLFDGRAWIISPQFVTLFDTYHLDEQKYHLERFILEAKKSGKTVSYSDDSYFYICEPFLYSDGKDMGYLVFQASMDSIFERTQNNHEKYLILFILVMAVMAVLCHILAKWISSPVTKLRQTAQEFHDGHRQDITSFGYSDLIETTHTINDMIDRLNEIDQSRKEFVSNVSHELKTPITSIRILADSLLQADAADTPAELYREFMEDISNEIDRETKIINDLLCMVRLDEQAVKMEFAQTDMNRLLENLLKRLKPIARSKNVELVLESFRQVTALVDETKLTLALSNLIENSIKYNKKDGWVHISLNADHKFFYVKIEDSGIGIAQEDINKIFDRFYRVDKARSRETGGTGLGLSITKTVIMLHGGVVRVHSKENEGTTFMVRIPLTIVAAKEDA